MDTLAAFVIEVLTALGFAAIGIGGYVIQADRRHPERGGSIMSFTTRAIEIPTNRRKNVRERATMKTYSILTSVFLFAVSIISAVPAAEAEYFISRYRYRSLYHVRTPVDLAVESEITWTTGDIKVTVRNIGGQDPPYAQLVPLHFKTCDHVGNCDDINNFVPVPKAGKTVERVYSVYENPVVPCAKRFIFVVNRWKDKTIEPWESFDGIDDYGNVDEFHTPLSNNVSTLPINLCGL